MKELANFCGRNAHNALLAHPYNFTGITRNSIDVLTKPYTKIYHTQVFNTNFCLHAKKG